MKLTSKFSGKTAKGHGGHAKRLRKMRSQRSFTLVEMLTAMTVLIIILGIIGAATNGARSTMQRSSNEIGEFAAARSAFEDMSQKLSQATLNTYWDYYDKNGLSRGYYASTTNAGGGTTNFVPATYGRMSDLHFFVRQNQQQFFCGQEVFFQTPVAYSTTAAYQDTQGLMNSCSYFVEYSNDNQIRPSPLTTAATTKWRYRLVQGLERTEKMAVYANVASNVATGAQPYPTQKPGTSASNAWSWTANIANENSKGGGPSSGNIGSQAYPVVDNVIALIIWPRLPLREDPTGNSLTGLCEPTITNDYSYDSQGDLNKLPTATKPQQLSDEQLPPIVQLTIVAIDEASAARIATNTKTPPFAIANAFTNAAAASGATPNLFSTSTQDQYNKDLTALGNALAAAKINYKIFNTYVVMRESKWSQ